MNRLTTKPNVDKILVAKAGTTLQVASSKFANDTNSAITVGGTSYQPGEILLGDGQIGFYNADTNTSIGNSATVATTKSIYIAQGRNILNDSDALPIRKVEKTSSISPVYGVQFAGEVCAVPTNSSVVIGAPNAASTGKVNVSSETSYEIIGKVTGRRTNALNGRNASFRAEFTTPDYTSLGYTVNNSRDHLLQSIAYDVITRGHSLQNLNRANPLSVFSLDTVNTSNTSVTTTTLTVVGTKVTVGYTGKGHNIYCTITESIAKSFSDMISEGTLTGTEGVVPIALTAAAVTAGGLGIAGSGTTTVDRIVLLANDTKRAFRDSIPQVKETINVGLPVGFDAGVANVTGSKSFEGKGLSNQWQLFYEKGDAFKYDSTLERFDGKWMGYSSDIVPNTKYAAYIISHNTPTYVSNGTLSYAPERSILLVPCCEETLKNAIEAVLNPYFSSSANTVFLGSLNGSNLVEVATCPS
tara:strand:+ start:15048 stop:16457 length:1410 start_codon:yes stop_codon:yes gene_type:complete